MIERCKIRKVHRIVSLLPAATEIAAALGLMDQVLGVSHECDFPEQANERPRVTHCPVHDANMASCEIDEWVRSALHDNGTIYTIDESLLQHTARRNLTKNYTTYAISRIDKRMYVCECKYCFIVV